jgi:ATP-dependent Clp protease ATP-binding subunit ClpA
MAKVLSDIHQDLDNQKGKPLSVLFLKGPTGVGKTEFVKQTAELLFGDKL